MDANGELKSLRKKLNNKGIAVVYLAILMIVLVGFVGLAVDIGYMYVAKGQLQNAADAAALAGAALLDSSNSTTQTAGRNEAAKLALANTATGVPVTIANDYSNTLSDIAADSGNDITVGNWDTSQTPKYSTTRTPVNALQVRARRTVGSTSSAQRMVDLFFAKAFGWQKMGASASAIANATRIVPGIVLCSSAGLCNMAGQLFYVNHNDPALFTESLAWSVFSTDASVPASKLSQFINGTLKLTSDLCGQCITTTQGTNVINDLDAAFSNPNFDKGNKDITGSTVNAWRIRVPLVDYPCSNPTASGCPPYNQGGNKEPYHVVGWAKMNITTVNTTSNLKGFVGTVLQCAYCTDPTPPLEELGLSLTATLVQ